MFSQFLTKTNYSYLKFCLGYKNQLPTTFTSLIFIQHNNFIDNF